MGPSDLVVVIGAAAAIAWVNWYFFLAQGREARAERRAGRQEITIVVDGGYEPGRVTVRRGEPVRLIFDRRETSGCSEEVVLPEFGIRRYLPAHQKTVVELTPSRTGTFDFTCGMSMLRGKLVVEEGEG